MHYKGPIYRLCRSGQVSSAVKMSRLLQGLLLVCAIFIVSAEDHHERGANKLATVSSCKNVAVVELRDLFPNENPAVRMFENVCSIRYGTARLSYYMTVYDAQRDHIHLEEPSGPEQLWNTAIIRRPDAHGFGTVQVTHCCSSRPVPISD